MQKKYIILLPLLILFFINSNIFSQPKFKGNDKYPTWEFLYEIKCSKCHTLERVFADTKTKYNWDLCVTKMMKKSPSWITEKDKEQIINEIMGIKTEAVSAFSPRKYNNDKLLFIDRCSSCHTLTQILKEEKSEEEWEQTVLRMRYKAPERFKDGDVPIIVNYLTKRAKLLKEDVAGKIMVKKCLICHDWGSILLEEKSREEWEECVNDMRKLARKKMRKDWFTYHEFNAIVDLLVKTQGKE